MPRPKKPGGPEPKRRSRFGCWPCKHRKIKCDEEHPSCANCRKAGETCDYSIRLNWAGRRGKRSDGEPVEASNTLTSPTAAVAASKEFKFSPFSASTAQTKGESSRISKSRSIPPVSPSEETPWTSTTTATFLASPVTPSSAQQTPTKLVDSHARPAQDDHQNGELSMPLLTPSRPGAAAFSSGHSALLFDSPISGSSPILSDTDSARMMIDEPEPPASTSKSASDRGRVSVTSLLSPPAGVSCQIPPTGASPQSASSQSPGFNGGPLSPTEPRIYGIDRGVPDLDHGKNDDADAIKSSSSAVSPSTSNSGYAPNELLTAMFDDSFDADDSFWGEFAFGIETSDAMDTATGGYYDQQVLISIPQHLEPLPSMLRENPMNLLYFHHFINHTARVLVPYDDPQANPFRTTLPRMAVEDESLLALLLTYSACHRARVLKHTEPSIRIARWVTNIFPALRLALSDPSKNFSHANLATAIMLASLDIVSPKVFGYSIPWQQHLGLARELIKARPGGLHFLTNFRQDNVCSFLFSWAAYLDVIGSLSGGSVLQSDSSSSPSSTAWMFDYEDEDRRDGFDEIDCIMGFTTRCVYLLAKIADLARRCDAERKDRWHLPPAQQWRPDKATRRQAQELEHEVKDSMSQPPRPCKHIHTVGNLAKWKQRTELKDTNAAFHWAALVHIYRRILARPREDVDVQMAVSQIIGCLERVKHCGAAESCLLFPVFTAGCDVVDESQRALILERLDAGQNHGMTQIHRARKLMERVWETDKPLGLLLESEFIG